MGIRKPTPKLDPHRSFPTPIETIGRNLNTTLVTIPATMLQYTSNNSWFALSNHTHSTLSAAGGVAIEGPGGTVQNSGTVLFANSNSISFGLANDKITASFSQSTHDHPYLGSGESTYYQTSNLSSKFLITAALSDHTHSNLYQVIGNYLTTAAQSNHTHDYQSTGAYLTTAMQSVSSSVFVKTGFSTTAITGTELKGTNNTDGLILAVPAWLTAAEGVGGGVGLNTAQTSVTWTVNSSGISINAGAYLTTAAATDHTHSNLYEPVGKTHSDLYMGTGERASFYNTTNNTLANSTHGHGSISIATASNSTVTALEYSSASSGITFSVPSWLTTAAQSGHTHSDLYQSTGAYLITAAVSNHTHSDLYINTSKEANFITSESTHAHPYVGSGDSTAWQTGTLSSALMPLSYSSGFQTATLATKFLTTAAATDHTHSNLYLPLGNSTQWATGTLSSALMPLSYSSGFQTATLATKFLTTAAATDHTHSNLYLPLGNSTQWATGTLSSALMPLSYSSGFQTATLATKFLTTAAAADHVHGANVSTASTAGVDIKFTSASNGLTVGVPAWITTGGGGGGIAASIGGGNSTSDGSGYSNITSGTIKIYGGDNVTLSQNGANITFIGASANGPASVLFDNTNGVSWGSASAGSTTTITASINPFQVAASAASTLTNGTLVFSNANNVSFGLNGSTMTASIGGDGTLGFYEPYVQTNTSAWVPGVGSWYFAPFVANNAIGGGRLNFLANNTSTAGIMVDVTGSYHSSQTGGKNQSYTYQLSAAIWSQGAGSNSTRWESIWGNTFSYGISHRLSVSQSGAASSVSASMYASISYIQDIGFNGETTMSQFATSHAASGTNTSMASTWLRTDGASIRNMLSNQQMLVVPFNTTISEGNYILGIMYSSTHATGTSGTSYPGASALIMSNLNVVGIARAALAGYRIFGQTTSNASDNVFFGAGVVYSAASAAAPQYLRTQDMATIANGIIPYFNFQRRGLTN